MGLPCYVCLLYLLATGGAYRKGPAGDFCNPD
jgi:hypothetical protein